MVKPACDLRIDHLHVVEASDGNSLRLKRSNAGREIGVAWHPHILLPGSLLVEVKKANTLLLQCCWSARRLKLRAELWPASAARPGYEQSQPKNDVSEWAHESQFNVPDQ